MSDSGCGTSCMDKHIYCCKRGVNDRPITIMKHYSWNVSVMVFFATAHGTTHQRTGSFDSAADATDTTNAAQIK